MAAIAYFRRCRDVSGEDPSCSEVRIPSSKEVRETIIPNMENPDCLILVCDRLIEIHIPELQNQKAILAMGIDDSKGLTKQCMILGSNRFFPSSPLCLRHILMLLSETVCLISCHRLA